MSRIMLIQNYNKYTNRKQKLPLEIQSSLKIKFCSENADMYQKKDILWVVLF